MKKTKPLKKKARTRVKMLFKACMEMDCIEAEQIPCNKCHINKEYKELAGIDMKETL